MCGRRWLVLQHRSVHITAPLTHATIDIDHISEPLVQKKAGGPHRIIATAAHDIYLDQITHLVSDMEGSSQTESLTWESWRFFCTLMIIVIMWLDQSFQTFNVVR